MLFLVVDHQNHIYVILDDNYHWKRYWKKALVVPLRILGMHGAKETS